MSTYAATPACHISVIIPAFNCADMLVLCLESIFASSYGDFECIVVDDHSSADLSACMKPYPIRSIRLDSRSGPAAARNRGAESAVGELLVFVDADVRLHADTLANIASAFETDPEMTALMGSYDDRPSAQNFFSQYKNLFHHYTHQVSNEEAGTFWAGCGAIRRSVFEAMNGFDERQFSRPCIEDIELGYRLKSGGHRIKLVKSVQVTHLKRWTFSSMLRSDIFDRALPWTRLIVKRGRAADDLNLKWSARCSSAGVLAAILSIPLAAVWPPGFYLSAAIVLMLIVLNRRTYAFFFTKRGWAFGLRAIPVHLLYLAYGGVAFGVGSILYGLEIGTGNAHGKKA